MSKMSPTLTTLPVLYPCVVSATASAPATTANLGPGYDCIALALQLRCEVSAEPADRWTVTHLGPERPPADSDDCVLAAAQRIAGGPLALIVTNEIPIGKGLGSSAAALVAGAAAAQAAGVGESDFDEVYRVAVALEGHADQVAAVMKGGLVLITAGERPIGLPIHSSIRVLVAVPDETLPTHQARTVIDQVQPLDTVVRSLARMSALTAGLVSGDRELLTHAGGDEIHEAPRASLSPIVTELIRAAVGAGAWHAARSGAGPSVVAFCSEKEVSGVVAAFEKLGVAVVDGAVDTTGLVVTSV